MPTHDILARVAAVISMMAALWNGFISILYVAMLIWFLVGFLWFVPLFLAVFQGIAAIAILVLGFNKPNPAVPAVGMFVSLCCFNVFGLMLELMAMGLHIGAHVTYNQAMAEDADDVDLVLAA